MRRHVVLQDLQKILNNGVALQRRGQLAVHVDWRFGFLESPGK